MIIELRRLGPEDFRASLRGDPAGVTGYGESPELAVGRLIYEWAESDDSESATETIDVRIVVAPKQ
jgi:hypothetical protein